MATVVVVDDAAADRALLETLLRHRGHRVLVAADAPDGLELIRRERPQLVITDVLLPSMDGYDMIKELRRDPATAPTRALILTAHYAESEVRRLALACGIEHVVSKPCEPDVLLARIEEALAAGPVPTRPRDPPDVERVDAEHLRVVSGKLFDKVAELERVNGLLDRLLAEHEEERRRIANAIHDDIIQTLAGVGARVHRLRGALGGARERDLVADAERVIRQTSLRLEGLLADLRPPVLDLGDGMSSALRDHHGRVASDGRPQLLVSGRLASDLRPELRVVLYRIAQEALTNACRHSGADRVAVEMWTRDDGALVRVRDDGRGFDCQTAAASVATFGLAAMRERAQLAGGWWRCESSPSAGTLVEFWVPA